MRERINRIQVRLNDKEYKHFLSLTKRSGLTMESYLRHLINGVIPKDLPHPDYHSMIKELHAIGNNMNQIAHIANATGMINEKLFAEAEQELKEAILKIMKAVTEPEKRK